MSLKTKFFSFLTVAIGIVGFSTFAMAQDTTTPAPKDGAKREKGRMHRGMERGMRGDFGHRGGGFGLRGLDLTDAQKEQIRVIRENNKPDAATIAEMKAIHEARKAGTAITPEQKERMKAIHEQSRAKRESVHQQMLAVLTPEQRAQIEKQKQEMQQRRQERKQKHQQAPAADKPKIS